MGCELISTVVTLPFNRFSMVPPAADHLVLHYTDICGHVHFFGILFIDMCLCVCVCEFHPKEDFFILMCYNDGFKQNHNGY